MASWTDFVHIIKDDPDPCPDSDFSSAQFRFVYGRVFAYLRYQGFDQHIADEAATEAITEAWEHGITFRTRPAWIRKAARHHAIRKARNVRWNPLVRLQAKGYEPPNAARDGTETYRAIEQHHELVVIMRQLPKAQRQVMALYIDGSTPSEIAGELGLAERTVYQRLKKARAHLRTLIEANAKGETR